MPIRPLPPYGTKIEVPRIESAVSVGVQASENASVTEVDADLALVSSNVSFIAGHNDVSRQLFERSQPGIDEVLSADLGAALGLEFDRQALYGSGIGVQTRGLLNVSGILSVSYTDASPSAAELIPKIWEAYNQLAGPNSGNGLVPPAP